MKKSRKSEIFKSLRLQTHIARPFCTHHGNCWVKGYSMGYSIFSGSHSASCGNSIVMISTMI